MPQLSRNDLVLFIIGSIFIIGAILVAGAIGGFLVFALLVIILVATNT